MDLIFPINFIGHNEWMESGYALALASGEVVSRDGEFLGKWRVVNYKPEEYDSGGCYEFIKDGQTEVMFQRQFGILDSRGSRGFALSEITRDIKEWHENQTS